MKSCNLKSCNLKSCNIVLVMDYDGTIHDSRVEYIPAFRRTMKEISAMGWIEDVPYTDEEICRWVGFSSAEMWQRFHPELSAEQRNHARGLIGQYMLADVEAGKGRLYPGVPETLDVLKDTYELYFFSNCGPRYMETHRKAFRLDRWFSRFYCTEVYGNLQKEQVFAEHIREPGRKYIAVGDRFKDINLARGCGLGSVGCLYGFGTPEELQGADICISDITELPAAAARLAGC